VAAFDGLAMAESMKARGATPLARAADRRLAQRRHRRMAAIGGGSHGAVRCGRRPECALPEGSRARHGRIGRNRHGGVTKRRGRAIECERPESDYERPQMIDKAMRSLAAAAITICMLRHKQNTSRISSFTTGATFVLVITIFFIFSSIAKERPNCATGAMLAIQSAKTALTGPGSSGVEIILDKSSTESFLRFISANVGKHYGVCIDDTLVPSEIIFGIGNVGQLFVPTGNELRRDQLIEELNSGLHVISITAAY
jgi:hypothetical protein